MEVDRMLNLSKLRCKIGALELSILRKEVGGLDNMTDEDGKPISECLIRKSELQHRLAQMMRECEI